MARTVAFLMIVAFPLAAAAADPLQAEIVAHRGASHDAPENTLAAVRLAWDQKADAVEFDVYLTKDGRIAVIHDRDTTRTAGDPGLVVTDTPLADLRTLDVGRWKGAKFAGEKIPTLAEVLATVPAGKKVFVEVKCGPEVVPELDRVLTASKLKPEQTAVISFDAKVVAAVKKARPDVPAYWIVSLSNKDKTPPKVAALVAKAREIGAGGLDLSAGPALDTEYAQAILAAGLKLYVWTVNDPTVARRIVGLGVDGITTDRPGWLREQLAK